MIMAIILVTIKCKYLPKIHTSSSKKTQLRSTLTAVEYPFHSTLDITDPQYESIDVIMINPVQQNEQPQESDYISTVESHATLYASVQENTHTRSYKDNFHNTMYSAVQKQSISARMKSHKTETPECASVQKKQCSSDASHTYSVVTKKFTKPKVRCELEMDDHVYAQVNKTKSKTSPINLEMTDHCSNGVDEKEEESNQVHLLQ